MFIVRPLPMNWSFVDRYYRRRSTISEIPTTHPPSNLKPTKSSSYTQLPLMYSCPYSSACRGFRVVKDFTTFTPSFSNLLHRVVFPDDGPTKLIEILHFIFPPCHGYSTAIPGREHPQPIHTPKFSNTCSSVVTPFIERNSKLNS